MARLAIRKVRYLGRNFHYESPILHDGLNILVGPNGSGKTTFSNLVYYGLSGDVESFRADRQKQHKEVVSDSGNCVELTVAFDSAQYVLTRYIGSNDIAVRTDEEDIHVLPIFRGKDTKEVFSDWLLGMLEIQPIHLQLGTHAWQMNVRDVFRLIYHDQSLDPSDVYKGPDGVRNFVVDSKVMRKAIFEVLIGKSFQDYYSALSKFRESDRRRNQLTGALDLFKETIAEIQTGRDDLNVLFIDEKIKHARDRLERLLGHRRGLASARRSEGNLAGLAAKQQELLQVELNRSELVSRDNDLLTETTHLQKVRSSLILESTQIKKMIFAHEQLSLFSANTCPYCLREVSRQPHHCVCGAEVDEKDYEHFFYEADEYLKILKSKQRNVDTVDVAIDSCHQEIATIRIKQSALAVQSREIRASIAAEVGDAGLGVDLSKIDEVDDQIVSLRGEIVALEQQRELESKRENLERKLAVATRDYESARRSADQLQAQAGQEMADKRRAFSEIYNDLMRKTVKDCRQASIDDDYVPVINAGEYKEASSSVPRRLMFYLALLKLSKIDRTVPFPRFLLVDTPDTAGIDQANLINSLSKVAETVRAAGATCQVILTTGEGKYPADAEEDVFAQLTDQNRLLQPK